MGARPFSQGSRITQAGNRPARALVGGLVIVLATCAAYIPALRSGFVWDDDLYLTENRIVQSASALPAIWSIGWDRESGRAVINTPQYYPLVFTSFWIEHRLWGLDPFGYHLVNVLLHAVNALLVWRIGRVLRIPGAWFIGAAFALHPVHVESVAWVTERKNVLSALFYLLALLAYLRFDAGGKLRWYLAAMLLFAAALLSKTVACTLPVVILLAILRRNGRIAPRNLLPVLPLLLIGAVFGLMTAYLERVDVGAAGAAWRQTFFERALIIAPRAFGFYAAKIVWPHRLMFIYPRWEIDATDWTQYLPLAGVVLIGAVMVLARRRIGLGPLLLLAFSAITLFPALGFFDVYPFRFSWVADHFQYLGSLGFLALLTVAGAKFLGLVPRGTGRRYASVGVACLVLLVLAGKTFSQSRSYKDAVRLWENTFERNPDAWIAALNLGVHAAAEGRYKDAAAYFASAAQSPAARADAYAGWANVLLEADNPVKAIAYYRRALECDPLDARTHGNLGLALMITGQADQAIESLQTSVELDPAWGKSWLSLGILHSKQGQLEQAARCLKRGAELMLDNPVVVTRYGDVLTDLGRYEEASQQYRAALALEPARVDAARGLIMARYRQGKYAEAVDVCQSHLARSGNDSGLLATQAWILATCPDDVIRDGTAALRLARRALEAGASDARVFDALAAASAECGSFDDAVGFAENALQRARRRGDQVLSAAIERRLTLYRENRPYRAVP